MVKRKEINNFNPYNRIKLNQYHQVQKQDKKPESKLLKKKQRDLERLINYDKVDPAIKQVKQKELVEIKQKIISNKKSYEKHKRKEFFLEAKYSKIKMVEQKKLMRMIKKVEDQLAQNPQNQQLKKQNEQLQRKMKYIKNFPKNLKYISLFPNNQLAQESKKFQEKIMNEIQEKLKKAERFKNSYQKQSNPKTQKQNIEKDKFFIVEQQQ